MFDRLDGVVGLWPGESEESLAAEDELVYQLTCQSLAEDWDTDAESRHVLPDGLEDLPVGLFLAAIVSTVDRSRLNGHDLVRLMRAEARLSASYEAQKLASMSEVAFCPPGNADSPVERSLNEVEYAACEIAPALTLTRRGAETQLDLALHLTGRLHRVLERFQKGLLDLNKVRVFASHLAHLDSDVIDFVLDRVLDAAGGLTCGQLRARLGRLVLEADPEALAHNMAEGLEDRKIATTVNPDLTGNLGVFSAHPERIAAASKYVHDLAAGLKTAEESRSLDQLKADIALDLLSGHCVCGQTNTAKGSVMVHAELETLARLSDHPGELAGYAPVVAEIVRKTVYEQSDGDWNFTITHNGRPVSTGTLNRRPTTAQKHHLQAVYQSCVFPGCRQPAYYCDLDHHQPVSRGGPTHNDNLGPLCRHHHMARHHQPWQVEQNQNGDHTWTSPLGHTYTRKRGPPN